LNIKSLAKASPAGLKPKHPAPAKFVRSGFFKNLESFRDLEKRISTLPTTKEEGDAFEVFAEAYFATQAISGAKPGSIRPLDKLTPELAKTLCIPLKDYGIDGIHENGFPATKPTRSSFVPVGQV